VRATGCVCCRPSRLWFPAGLIGADMLVGVPVIAFGLGQNLPIVLYLMIGIISPCPW